MNPFHFFFNGIIPNFIFHNLPWRHHLSPFLSSSHSSSLPSSNHHSLPLSASTPSPALFKSSTENDHRRPFKKPPLALSSSACSLPIPILSTSASSPRHFNFLFLFLWPTSCSFQFFHSFLLLIYRSNVEVNIVSLLIIILLSQHKGVLKFCTLLLNFLKNCDCVYFSNKLIYNLELNIY